MDDQEFLTDMVMKRLRTSDGLDLKWVGKRFGPDVATSILKGANLGLELGKGEESQVNMSIKVNVMCT
jgi:hypothetical protein